jgi:hypothetical protein
MRITAQRKDRGEPLRAAMREAGIGLTALAARTKLADPDGKGVSYQLLGFLTKDAGKAAVSSARETCSVPSAALIAKALGEPVGALFDIIEAPSRSDPQPAWEDLQNVSTQ